MIEQVNLWVIEDDDGARDSIVMLLKEVYSDLLVTGFSSVNEACLYMGSPDIILVDVGSITLGLDGFYQASLAPFRNLVDNHPGANYCVYSGINKRAVDTVAEIKEENPDVVISHENFSDLLDFVESVLN